MPSDQYGSPKDSGAYRYADDVALKPPSGAAQATVDLLYQPTSWEYIQFLALANTKSNTFLNAVGEDALDAWLNTAMAPPYVMASTTWSKP